MYIDDAHVLYAELESKGADLPRTPEETFYGIREFDVRDPDGHVIAFGQGTWSRRPRDRGSESWRLREPVGTRALPRTPLALATPPAIL